MRIISFSWTTPALLAGAKTVTRREWSASYARRFHKGDLVGAYDRSLRYKGKQVATIRLTQDPYLENTANMPQADFEAEGLAWMEERGAWIQGLHPHEFWACWRGDAKDVWVVRFEVVNAE